ncbi:hypothetical protein BSKO_08552 [Bryopsis sp. KO-2023]|nr:hypothetical protein BSKO_08552 [Bryopsis sp. KO-2023]
MEVGNLPGPTAVHRCFLTRVPSLGSKTSLARSPLASRVPLRSCPVASRRTGKCSAVAAEESPSPSLFDLPKHLREPVAIVEAKNPDAPGEKTTCYILGISHVSQNSCDQIEDLINAVEPEVVLVELCKDRVGLLTDRNTQGTQTWHARKVSMTGASMGEGWPSEKEILSLCKACRGRPIQVQDIEDDVFTLLSTGLFSRGRPMFSRAEEDEAPAFLPRVVGGKLQVQSVPPLGVVEFQMRDRSLPPLITIELRVDSSLQSLEITEEEIQNLCAEALQSSKDGTRSLTVYLKLRQQLLDLCEAKGLQGVVIFQGEERGRAEVVLRARRPSDPPLLTGFEEGAEGGAGWGIDAFRPAKRPYKLSEKMSIPQAALDKIIGNDRVAKMQGESSVEVLKEKLLIRANEYREWEENEKPIAYDKDSKGVADYFGGFITSMYGKFQSDAGRKVGVDPGAAWRTAMETSVKKGVRQLLLFDMPTSESAKHLAQSIFVGMGTRFALAFAFSLSVAAALSAGVLPEMDNLGRNATIATALVDAAILWPIFVPYLEIYRLSTMSKEEIEDAVKVKVPIQEDLDNVLKLFGEDALLDWPGAMVPIIDERDKYMARNLHAAAKGAWGASPAFIQDVIEDKVVLRYMMPGNGPRKAAPMGKGDGEYVPLQGPKSAVAIVGSAHVRGMVKEWERLENTGVMGVEEFLY